MSSGSTDKPEYIFRDGGMIFAPPYLQADAFLSGWLVPSDKAAQQALLDRTVNRALAGGSLRYHAVFPRLMLSFADIRQVSSLDPQHRDFGYVTEKDVTIWFLAAAKQGHTIQRLVWFLPYIWVDNPLAVVVGREVFGFPKQLASMHIPGDPRDGGPFFAKAPALATYQASSEAVTRPLLDLGPSDREAAQGEVELSEGELERLASFFPSESQPESNQEGLFASAGNLVSQFVSNLRRRALPILFLKQFPDATTPGRACYQRVVEAPASITALDKIGIMPGSWSAELYSHASHQLHQNLGVSPGRLELGRGLYLKYSFSMDMGVEIG